MGGSCHSSIVISSFSCPCFIRVDSWLISWRVVGGTCADILPRDATAETSRTAFAISDRDLRHGSNVTNRCADVFEPRRRPKTGGEKNGNNDNKSITRWFAHGDNKTRRVETETDATAISCHAGVRNGAAVQQRVLEQSQTRDLRRYHHRRT